VTKSTSFKTVFWKRDILGPINSSFKSVFCFLSSKAWAGDTKVIQKNFNYEGTFKTSGWAMTLEPKDELLRKVIANVKIEGGEFVEKVNVNEKSGNSTAIVFSKVKGD
jgi:hypothetical protein